MFLIHVNCAVQGAELVVIRPIDEKQQNLLHVYEFGTKGSYQHVQLAYFHRMLYGNSVYSGMVRIEKRRQLMNLINYYLSLNSWIWTVFLNGSYATSCIRT